MKRIPSLDGLRAVSVAAVIVGHMVETEKVPWAAILAGVGVNVFFAISGFLITTLLQQEYAKSGKISLRDFYCRRCFRIFPAAYVFILAMVVVFPEARRGLPYAATYSVSYFFQATPEMLRHLWSLSVEEQFYMLWPLALVIVYKSRAKVAIGAICLATVIRVVIAFSSLGGSAYIDANHYLFTGSMDSIAMGCLFAIYQDRLRSAYRWMVEINAVVIVLPVIAFILYSALWGDPRTLAGRMLPILWPLFCAIVAIWVFLLVERNDWLFNNWLAVRIGGLSYSLYLWQQPFTTGNFKPWVAVPAMLGCAIASYLLVENPMIALGKRAVILGSVNPDTPSHPILARGHRTAS